MIGISGKNSFQFFALFWFVVSVFYFIALNLLSNVNFYFKLIDAIIFFIFFLSLGYVAQFPARFISFETNSIPKIFFNHAVASMISTALWLGISYIIVTIPFIEKEILDSYRYSTFFNETILWRIIIGMLIYSVFVIYHYTLLYYQSYREKVEHEAKLKTHVVEAELRNLRFQINPHFIFNSLNSISSLTISNPQKAREMTILLSDFLRYALAKSESNFNSIREELKNVNLYLSIEKIRFGDKFNYIQIVPAEVLDFEIPSMILQPIFENAIKHGVYESLEPIQIKLECEKRAEHLSIRIKNNYDPEISQNKGEGVGLKNIKERLKLIYGLEGLLSTKKEKNLFVVEILIPQIGR